MDDDSFRRELHRRKMQDRNSSSDDEDRGSIFSSPSSQYPSQKLSDDSPTKPEDWPSKWKGTEWYLKYPPKNEEVPTKWPSSGSSRDIDAGIVIPEMIELESSYDAFENAPDKNDSEWESDQSGVVPGKSSGSYEYPSISIDGEDKKLYKLFKKIPKD